MQDKAKEVTREGKYAYVEYARLANGLVVFVYGTARYERLLGSVNQRLGKNSENSKSK